MADYEERILPGAIKSVDNIPVMWNMNRDRVIGRASFNADTNIVTMAISDPDVVSWLKSDLQSVIVAPGIRLGVEVRACYNETSFPESTENRIQELMNKSFPERKN